jgi:hypothetical protein
MVRNFARPLLTADGFERVRGRAFVKMVEGGSAASVSFERTSGQPPAELFYLEGTVLPRIDIEWRESDGSVIGPDYVVYSGGRYFRRYPPPEHLDAQSPERSSHEYWFVHPTDATVEVCGSYVERMLREEVLPLLNRLMDRRELLAEQTSQLPGVQRDKMTEILLRLPDGDVETIEALIEAMIARAPHTADSEFVKWVRTRIANLPGSS